MVYKPPPGYCAERRKRRREAGLCRDCKNLALVNKSLCEECLSKNRERVKRRYRTVPEFRNRVILRARQQRLEPGYIETHRAQQRLSRKKPSRRAHKREYETTRYRSDPLFKLTRCLRRRFYMAVRYQAKSGSAVKDLGCSISQFKEYIEKQFLPGMSWSNYGKWHLDHIRPLSSVNLVDRGQVIKVCHYTNIQPLWAEDNLRKGSKMEVTE